MSVWSASESPPYHAISYARGGASHVQCIFIDEKPVKVGLNCCIALFQAQLHYPLSYVWIDALCIDQANVLEKTAQVARMSQIYEGAIEVLACVGLHESGSKFLFDGQLDDSAQWEDVLRAACEHRGTWYLNYPIEHLYATVCAGKKISIHNRLRNRIPDLLERPYFSRPWIYQELVVARQKRILCGYENMSGTLFDLLVAYSRKYLKPDPDIKLLLASKNPKFQDPARRLELAASRDLDLHSLLSSFGNLACADPRDRIYGLLPLVNWQGRPAIEPDYGRSSFQLALTVYDYLTTDLPRDTKVAATSMALLLSTLAVDDRDTGLQLAVSRRTTAEIDTSTMATKPHPSIKSCTQQIAAVTVRKLETRGGSLCISPWTMRPLVLVDGERVKYEELVSTLQSPSCAYTGIWSDETLVGMVCEEAKEGDSLLFLQSPSRWSTDATCFVLRRQEHSLFSVIGLAFFATPLYGEGYHTPSVKGPQGRTNLSLEDVLLPVAQRHLSPDDKWAYLNRMAMTRQTVADLAVNPAPVIYPESCGGSDSESIATDSEDDNEEAANSQEAATDQVVSD